MRRRIWIVITLGLLLAIIARIVQVRTEQWERMLFYARVEQELLQARRGPDSLGEGHPAEQLLLCNPMGLALAADGSLLISDRGRDRRGRVVWRIDATGLARLVAGSGLRGDATQTRARELRLDRPESMALLPDGGLLLSDGFNHVVLRIHPDGRVERFAGTGESGYSGDGCPAVQARLDRPAAVVIDRHGRVYIADVKNERVRMVDASGTITTVVGTGEKGFSPDGTRGTEARLDTPWGIGLDLEDRLLIGDGANHRIRRLETDGTLVTLAGTGIAGYSGDGGPALEARLNYPEAFSAAPDGRLYFGDEWNNTVRVIEPDGTISTVIGLGHPGRAFVGGIAGVSPVADPESVLWTPDGLIVSDGENGRVLRIDEDGVIHLVAGRSDVESCAEPW